MMHKLKKRIISFVLCVSMVVPMLAHAVPVYSVGATDMNGATTNYGAKIGAVGTVKNSENLLLANMPAGQSVQAVINGVDISGMLEKIVITNYYYDDTAATDDTRLWYEIDAAPGYEWPVEYAEYHWTYAYSVDVLSVEGMTGVFDADGNAITSLTLPLYDKIPLTATSSLQGSVKYQWQIEYEDGKWVDIYGEDEAELTVSIGMIATLLMDDSVNVRCVSSSASKTAISDSIAITVDFNIGDDEGDEPVEPTVPTLEIQMDGASADSITTTYGNYDFKATLTAATTLSGSLTYKWEVLTDATNDLWSTLSTDSICYFTYEDMQFKYYDASSDISTIRLTVSNGETSLTDTFVVYRVAEVYVTGSTGDTTGTVDITVSGSLPNEASLNLGDASDTTIGGVDASEIALALDVTITQYGEEWQPEEGETVRVSIPASQLGLNDGEYFTVYHIHDGKTELLGPFKVENGYVTFEIDGFSVVVISTNYGASIGGVADFADDYLVMDSAPVDFAGTAAWTKDLPAKVVIKNYYFDECLGKLFYEIDAAPGYTWPEAYANLHWCYSDELTNIDVNGSMGVFDENGEPVSYIKMPISSKPTYTVQSSLTGEVKYQWQVCYDVGNYLWMDITGQTSASITLSYALLAGVVDENGMCAVRCVISNAVKTQEGYPMVIAISDDSTDEPTVENSANITVDGVSTNSAEIADKYDEWNDAVGEYVPVEGGSLELSVNTNLTGDDITYQWQGLSGSDWVTISTDKDYQLTFSDLVYYQAYSGSTAYIRVVVTQGEKVIESEQLVVTIVEVAALETTETTYSLLSLNSRMLYATPASLVSANDGIATAAEDSNTVLVTVQFVMGNATIPIENGVFTYNVPYNGNVTDSILIPEVQGYEAYLEDDSTTPVTGTYNLSETNVTEAKTITFRFWPAEVSYKVVFMQQNIEDDGYTIVRTDDLTGLTGSDPAVEKVTYEGFVQIWCDTDKIAADGSTVIEVKYDRLYFKMLFDLDGGYGVQPVYARYGTPVTVNNPTKAGYIFMGWNADNGPHSDDNDATVDIGTFMDISIPAEHTSYTAIWQASETAKVTVVIWGQNPDDDGYSYMADESNELSFQAKPGTVVTYNPNGGYVCGYTEEHIHGEGECESTCGKEEHTHSAVGGACYSQTCGKTEHTAHSDSCYTCGITNHNHTTACYSSVGTKRTPATGMPSSYSEGYVHYHWYYGKLIYIDGVWYEYSGSAAEDSIASTTCGKTEGTHTHTDACIGSDSGCPGIHTHTDACYTLTCAKIVHSHNATCYEGCTKEEHTHGSGCALTINGMSSSLWKYSHSDTVTVAADGSTVLNVYYERTEFTIHFHAKNSNKDDFGTITDRWGANIEDRFYEACEKAGYNSWSEKQNATSPWTNHLEIMPAEDRIYYSYEGSGSMKFIMTYYKESFTDGEYEKAFEVELHRSNYTTVSEEEYIELEGFVINHSKSTDVGERTDGAVFYYDRDAYNFVFDNYGTTEKNESVLYQAPLSTYATYSLDASQAPSVYQAGSVTFKGWYLSPQVPGNFNFESVTPFDFANSTMPASDLILYAWWEPVKHNVTFYYDHAALEADMIYVADGITYDYEVPHGSTVQDPYTPPVDPTSQYYSFVGWFYVDDLGQEQMWDFTNTTVTRDVQLYGKWNSTTPAAYEVKFVTVKEGKEIPIADPISGQALGGTAKTFDAKFNEDLYEGYQDRYYPRVMSHTITINLEDTSKNTFTFYYDYVEYTSYTVKYLNKETGEPMPGVAEKKVTQNTYAMVTETFVPIAGYLPDAYQKVCKIDLDGTNEIIFYYTKDDINGLWTVHYWLENLDGTYTEDVDRLFTGTAKIGAAVTAPTDTVIEKYTYYTEHPNNVSSGTISKDAVTHLHMYYNRTRHDYIVQYLEAGTNKALAPEKVVRNLRWETLVTESANIDEINFNIYQVYGDAEKSLEISVDETKNVITFYYIEKEITLNYRVVGPEGCGTVAPVSETVKINTGIASGSIATVSDSTYKFVGWYDNEECAGDVLSTSTTYVPIKEDGTLWIDGTTYYAKFEYNLTSLTINKQGWNSIDADQTFLFKLTDEDGLELTVTVHGNGSIIVDGLTVGKKYKIVEISDWSWRYLYAGIDKDKTTVSVTETVVQNGAEFTLSPTGNVITFNNTRPKYQWLDGNSYKVNIFNGKSN